MNFMEWPAGRAKYFHFSFAVLVLLAALSGRAAGPTLGDAPTAPKSTVGLPGNELHPNVVTGGFGVDVTSREQVREFYNAVYTAAAGVPMNTTADVSSCTPGTNSTVFKESVLQRINWFRAMAGLPATVTFNDGNSTNDQQAAVMMSANGTLSHTPPPTWSCFTLSGSNAAAMSNLAYGNAGADAITAYIWDFGANNAEVGHRRWILYPQTQVMGTGDVPPTNGLAAANATWVFDANLFGTRPSTRQPYVAWPPAGYVPYAVTYPQWSFALTNANFTNATVTMLSNGVNVAVNLQPVQTGFGENTLVWYPSGLDPTTNTTVFPFSGTDTVYSITVANIKFGTATVSYSYNVTLFDPAIPGADYFPLVISGTNQPFVNAGNPYKSTPSTNPNVTGYQWLTVQATNGNLVDNALNGLVNFSYSPTPPPGYAYPIITLPPTGTGNCFHLTHTNPVPQLLQLNEQLFPATNATVAFKSLLGYATTTQIARVQVLAGGGTNWQNLYSQQGNNGSGESAFSQHTLSLSNYAGGGIFLRFNYDITNGSYYPQTNNYIGWCLENIVVTNAQQLLNATTNSTVSTNFVFTPGQTGNYVMQARGVIFTDFPTDWGLVDQLTAVAGPPVITLSNLMVLASQVKINFTVTSGMATNFHLLQAGRLGNTWMTNGTAMLTTNIPGISFQFTTTNGPAMQFYRVQTP